MMGNTLQTLRGPRGATQRRKRIGRGPGSGTGEQSGKGVKGQKARTGHHGARLGFEGGQMPMQRRFPKRGFQNPFRRQVFAVNVGDLGRRFSTGIVDLPALKEMGLVPRRCEAVKILGQGEIGKKLTVRAFAFSISARDKIEKLGGKVEIVP